MQASSHLCTALGALALGRPAREPLRGLPVSQGRHTRFGDDDGAPQDSPASLVLRGLPAHGMCPECGEAYEIDKVREEWMKEVGTRRGQQPG